MQSVSNRVLTTGIFLLLSACDSGQISSSLEKKELDSLETALARISESPESEWLVALDRLRGQTPESPRVREIQQDCVNAYEKYGDALTQLTHSRELVRELETAVADNQSASAAGRKEEAARAIAQTDRLLDEAEALVADCSGKRQRLRSALAASE